MIKTYIPHSLPEIIKTSHFHDLPGMVSDSSSLSYFHNALVKPELINITKTSLMHPLPDSTSIINNHHDRLDLFAKNQEIEKSSFSKNFTDSIDKWLNEFTSKNVFKFLLEEGPGLYLDIRDRLEDLKKQQNEGKNLNDIFHSTSASEYFNGGLGDDTVVYSGKYNDYQVVKNTLGYQVYGKISNEIDTLVSIEHIGFSDGHHMDLSIVGSSGMVHI